MAILLLIKLYFQKIHLVLCWIHLLVLLCGRWGLTTVMGLDIVGAALNVHEGPQSISFHYGNTTPLQKGMIVSNEPGYYKDHAFVIRIEPWILMAMARDGLLPPFFSDVNKKTQVPVKGTVVTGFGVATLAFFMDVDQLASMIIYQFEQQRQLHYGLLFYLAFKLCFLRYQISCSPSSSIYHKHLRE